MQYLLSVSIAAMLSFSSAYGSRLSYSYEQDQNRSPATLSQQAEREAREFWLARITRCGEDYFTRNRDFVHQFKSLEISVTSLGVSQADQLNGIQWQGRTAIRAAVSRVYSSKRTINHDVGWSKWSQGLGDALGMVGVTAQIRKDSGQWIVTPNRISPSGSFQPVDCSNPLDFGEKRPEPIRDEGTPSRIVLIGNQKARVMFDLKFWESDGSEGSKKSWGPRFAQSDARFITWFLVTEWDQAIESPLTSDLKAVWFKINDDNTLLRYPRSEQTGGSVVKMTNRAASFSYRKGWSEPGRWAKGRWKVKIYQNDILVIDGQFEIY